MQKTRVLVFPCGAENGLNVINALKYNIHFELFGATSREDHSEYVLDNEHLYIGDYNIHNNNFLDVFNALLEQNEIDFIIPTHDEIVLFLMQNQDNIKATVVASPAETCEVAFSKIKTFDKLKGAFYLPNIYKNKEKIRYPVFIKPNHGAGGKGTRLIKNAVDFSSIDDIDEYLISEYLPGDEYTIDCFTNKKGELLFVGPRTRERITNGVSFRSKNIELNDDIKSIAEDINSRLKFRGLWFFQLKKDVNNEYKLMEIAVRCAGTMDLYRELGVNFLSLTLFDFMGYDIDIICNKYNIELDRFYKSSYKISYKYEYVYVDFDDTIIINDKVNLVVMSFLYQCFNRKIKVILLTKHSTDIYKDLEKYCINKKLFNDIIHLREEEKKSDYIKQKNSIFIDNYFFDRKEVLDKSGIPVFDVDAVESLLIGS